MMKVTTRSLIFSMILACMVTGCTDEPAAVAQVIVEKGLAVPMRDGTILRADLYRPSGDGPFPVLLYRTPYGKHFAVESYQTHLRAVERGYAVVLQDVRGRYASDGVFSPYQQEGHDGFDTISWAAAQPWSNGDVGTFGLSYPGAVQWLAAMESPPALKAMAPAMTFSSPQKFFYMNGVFDLSWLPWIYYNIAPDARLRLGLPGITSYEEAAATWDSVSSEYLEYLPLAELPYLREEAPYYFEWLRHPPDDSWWDWAELRGRYAGVSAAVLNMSGWYDDPYGPVGAITNHNGLSASRDVPARSHLIVGPWKHGVLETGERVVEEVDFGSAAAIDYDEVILRFFDEYLRDEKTGLTNEAPVRYFVMGSNQWRESAAWPPANTSASRWCLSPGLLAPCDEDAATSVSVLTADPDNPVTDPYDDFGPHDYKDFVNRDGVLTFDSAVLEQDITVSGDVLARLFLSCDCEDFDIWVRILDIHPDGRAINMRTPGDEVVRMSYRDIDKGRQLLVPGQVYELELGPLMFANTFKAGHRIRVQITESFSPYVSRNLHTGESEVFSREAEVAQISVHHGGKYPTSVRLPIAAPDN